MTARTAMGKVFGGLVQRITGKTGGPELPTKAMSRGVVVTRADELNAPIQHHPEKSLNAVGSGALGEIAAGNLIWGSVRHETNRLNEPNLHNHNVVPNETFQDNE